MTTIELTMSGSGSLVYIVASRIETMWETEESCAFTLIGNEDPFYVQESVKEILDMIKRPTKNRTCSCSCTCPDP